MERTYRAIVATRAEGVERITLNRPERRNALGPEMVNEVLYALEYARSAPEVQCIVITGAGSVFCAGGDFGQMSGKLEAPNLPSKGTYEDLLMTVFRSEKPVIARVNGHAFGGGLGLVAASTFAVASLDAKLGTPEVDVGLFPFMISAVLERVMGRRALLEMMVTGAKLTAEEAAQRGLVNKAVPATELDPAVDAYVESISRKSPTAIRLGLRAVGDLDGLPMNEKLPRLNERLMECLGTEDAREGLAAFVEKRAPKWTGR